MHDILDTQAAAPRFHQTFHHDAAQTRAELGRGLLAAQATIEPKFLYDELGSCLFSAVTHLPEYYPTRTEAQIMARHAGDIAQRAGNVQTLIDLGAGDCAKAESLFPTLLPQQYVPVDISVDYLRAAVRRLQAAHPALEIVALGQDFSHAISLPDDVLDEGRLFFYPGSSIGNCAPAQALAMLRRIRAHCSAGGGLLIGVDRLKSPQILVPAYDDALQVTAAFNRNLLLHLNRILDTDFQLEDWRHVARFNSAESRIEMHLQAAARVTVCWPEGEREFAAGESIHTENSYKYRPQAFAAMLQEAGYRDIEHWTDTNGWFSVFHARA